MDKRTIEPACQLVRDAEADIGESRDRCDVVRFVSQPIDCAEQAFESIEGIESCIDALMADAQSWPILNWVVFMAGSFGVGTVSSAWPSMNHRGPLLFGYDP
ncbi:hypothetical protein [Paraburkholderia sp. BCC1885]|uniref:hypothetical protein n=1 Tax=Paraburkholderia sp. BCC1885 TaxID=2562669 RepID=UPI0011825BBB|nr:hypothetical protein [Paraburkholderia sp. BCC1885]